MDKNNAIVIGSLGIASVISFGLYYFFTKEKKIILTPWLEEYVKEVEAKLAVNKENPAVDVILSIFALCSELEDYIYLNENQRLEAERVDNINNKEKYEHLVDASESAKNRCTTEAVEYLEKRLGVSFAKLHESLKQFDKITVQRNIEIAKKAYTDLPKISTDKLREAYRSYVQLVLTCENVTKQQIAIAERNPDYEGIAMKIIHMNRSLMEDTVRKNFDIRPKYFNQLIREHKLHEEPEIQDLMETFKAIC